MLFLLLTNGYGPTRREQWNGKSWLVAPLSMLVPGVLPGSEGPLLYPHDEVGRNPSDWNGMPIVVYHPFEGGRPVSARSPSVLSRQGIGFVFHAQMTDKLQAEGWFEEEATKKVDPRIYNALLANKPMELSTGLFTRNEPTSGIHNGVPYVGIARDYRPDHLAILPDKEGACSLRNGCGLNINHVGDPYGDTFTADQIKEILALVGNMWSDAAREAAAKSRAAKGGNSHADQASSAANKASEDAKNPPPGKFNATHGNAATLHSKAAAAHMNAAGKANLKPNGQNQAKAHHDASRAHATAAHEHSLIGRGLAANEETDWSEEETEPVCEVPTINKDYLLMGQLHGLLFPNGQAGYVEDAKNGVVIYATSGKTFKRGYQWKPDEKGSNVLHLGDDPSQEVKSIGGYYRRPKVKPPTPDRTPAPATNDGGDVSLPIVPIGTLLNPSPLEGTMNRNQMIAWLTTNCSCWKDKEDKLALEKMQDGHIQRIYNGAVQTAQMAGVIHTVRTIKVNADGSVDAPAGVDLMALAKFLGVDTDPGSDPAGFMKEIAAKLDGIKKQLGMDPNAPAPPPPPPEGNMDGAAPDATPTGNRRATTPPPVSPAVPPSLNQWLQSAPPEAREVWNNAVETTKREHAALVERIISVFAVNEQQKAAIRPVYQAMKIPQLRALVSAMPTQNLPPSGPFDSLFLGNGAQQQPTPGLDFLPPPLNNQGGYSMLPNYSGAGGGAVLPPVQNGIPGQSSPYPFLPPLNNQGQQQQQEEEPLVPPTINWGEETRLRRNGRLPTPRSSTDSN